VSSRLFLPWRAWGSGPSISTCVKRNVVHSPQATQLVRAIATLLEFNPQEEQHVKDFLEYKVCTSPSSYYTHLLVLTYCSLLLIGASVSEPLSIHLNVKFICLSVRLSVMDWPLTVNHFQLLFYMFCVMR